VFVIVGSTTVSTVPVTTSIVVSIVTRLVALPGWLATRPFDFADALVALGFVFAILAFAACAVFELIALATGTTAISLVPATPGIVVFVVAEAITDEVFCAARTLDFGNAFIACELKSAVQAFAFRAICIVLLSSAAISSIPGATSDVVSVIAIVVSLPSWLCTFFFDFVNAVVTFRLVFTV